MDVVDIPAIGTSALAVVRSTPVQPLPRPLPREIVRDLLGITRALYRAELVKPTTDRARMERLVGIGQQFRRALDMSARYGADTMAGRAAFEAARNATEQLGDLVADSAELTHAVAATAARLRGSRLTRSASAATRR